MVAFAYDRNAPVSYKTLAALREVNTGCDSCLNMMIEEVSKVMVGDERYKEMADKVIPPDHDQLLPKEPCAAPRIVYLAWEGYNVWRANYTRPTHLDGHTCTSKFSAQYKAIKKLIDLNPKVAELLSAEPSYNYRETLPEASPVQLDGLPDSLKLADIQDRSDCLGTMATAYMNIFATAEWNTYVEKKYVRDGTNLLEHSMPLTWAGAMLAMAEEEDLELEYDDPRVVWLLYMAARISEVGIGRMDNANPDWKNDPATEERVENALDALREPIDKQCLKDVKRTFKDNLRKWNHELPEKEKQPYFAWVRAAYPT